MENETESHATQHILESNNEAVVHYIIKPETPSIVPASGVCGELEPKEELCFDESKETIIYQKDGKNNKNTALKLIYLVMVNKALNNVAFVARVSKKRPILKLISLLMVNLELTNMQTNYKPRKKTIIYQEYGKNYNPDDYIKLYTKNNKLKAHILSHNEQKPHKCDVDVCGKCFKKKDTLKTHLHVQDLTDIGYLISCKKKLS
uniref:C2H2-type domain-containing protein n=1 Tax=Timema douglasi TaxID=61478 RepID=A0A7R8VYD3_TIMDO|nr:unnamed protein product [Timema douglasi]